MQVEIVNPREIDSYLEEKKAIVVDVRKENEFMKKHIRGAINIPFDEDTRDVSGYRKGANYLLYCEHGNLSMIAAGILIRKGISAKTAGGGISAYNGTNLVDSGTSHH